MLENADLEGLAEARAIYDSAISVFQEEEQRLVEMSGGSLRMAVITCSGGFNIPVAVNNNVWNNSSLPIGGQVERLHEIYHVLEEGECGDLTYSFLSS